MDRDATRAANSDFYASHPEMVRDGKSVPIDPCDPRQQALRNEWMANYTKRGGKVEPARGREQACTVREVKKSLPFKSCAPVAKPVTNCPLQRQQPIIPPQLPPPPSKPPKAKPCRLVKFDLACEHGRHAGPEGTLMVVPKSTAALGDSVTGTMSFDGGCGEHAAWAVDGYWTKDGRGTSLNFWAQSVQPSATGFITLQHVTPQTYSVSANACVGARSYQVQAYPPGKVIFKLDFRSWWNNLKKIIQEISLDQDDPEEHWKTICELEYSGSWQENSRDWQAYYEKALVGSFGAQVSHEWQLYPPGVLPAKVAKYLAAGLYLEVAGGGKFTVAYKAKYWPANGRTDIGEYSLGGSIGVDLTLALKLKLVDRRVVEAGASASTFVGIEGERVLADPPEAHIKLKFDGLKARFTLKVAWGWIELSREYQIVQAREHDFLEKIEHAE